MQESKQLRRSIGLCLAIAWLAVWAGAGAGREARGDDAVRKSMVVYAGEPFGVGRVVVELPTGKPLSLAPDAACWLTEKNGRVLYPVCQTASVRTGLDRSEILVTQITGWFLFRGNEPLNVSLDADTSLFRVEGAPASSAKEHNELLKEWWERYSSRAVSLKSEELHPAVVENYLVPMLARRLNLKAPDLTTSLTGRGDIDGIVGLLVGTESIRLAMQKERTLGNPRGVQEATEPLPEAVKPPAVNLPKIPEDVEIEEIAEHVPQECFYVRCRDFKNYRWMRENTVGWGGTLRDLVSLRGVDYDIRNRVEAQLSLREGLLARLFGGFVMTDMAVIGSDVFFREGVAVGVMFQANRSPALGKQIEAQRRQTLDARGDVTDKQVTIADHEVSLLSSPDHTVRSFYAVDGQYHLVTNSETIVRRFYEAGAGKQSLAKLPEFRHARHLFPVSREDELFIYFSDPFFARLISPHYRIEMTRRMLAETDLQVLSLARLAAAAEKQAAKTVDDLVRGGFLPADFGKRPDGSRAELLADGRQRDSLRGTRRTFLPIPDVKIEKCTPAEAKSYVEFAAMYRSLWERMDPVAIAVHRVENAEHPERERAIFDLHISPLARDNSGFFLNWLAPADLTQFAPVAGNLISFTAVGRNFFSRDLSQMRVGGGFRDRLVPFVVNRGQVTMARDDSLEELPVYVTVERDPKMNGDKPVSIVGDPLKHPRNETVKTPYSIWQRWNDNFELFVSREKLAAEVFPQLKLEKGVRPAQIRLKIADFTGKQVLPFLQTQAYCRARQTSQSNVNLFHNLMQQLHVAPEQVVNATRDILGAEPICPLRGKYVRVENRPGPVRWKSSAWKAELLSQVSSAPADYKSPILEWFRGLEVEFNADRKTDVLSTHVEVELQPGVNDN